MPLSFVAMLFPKPDRIARVRPHRHPINENPLTASSQQVEEIAQEVCQYIKANEPGVLQYQWFRVVGAETPTIVVWEM